MINNTTTTNTSIDDSALDLISHLRLQQVKKNLSNVSDISPDLTEELLSDVVNQPLKVIRDRIAGRDYLLCDYNRNGDSYRSPWTNTYTPPSNGNFPSDRLRQLEIVTNQMFEQKRKMYFEGGVSSVYFWDLENGFAGVILIKKFYDGSSTSEDCCDSFHVVVVEEKQNARSAYYKLTSTVMLWLQTDKTTSGMMNLAEKVTRQLESDRQITDFSQHMINISTIVEQMENEIHQTFISNYSGKIKEVPDFYWDILAERALHELLNELSKEKSELEEKSQHYDDLENIFEIEYSYPLLTEPIDDRWSNVASLALPDGAHNRQNDLIYFHLPSLNDDQTLFGIASYRQIDADSVTNKEADVTRNSIQKSVCLLLRRPVYGSLNEELQLLTEKYFEGKDFNKRKLFEEFVDNLNLNPPKFNLECHSARDLVIQYRRKTLILFKLILLQKKVLFMLTPIENLVKTIMSLVSLIPDLISDGLNECTLVDEKSNFENEISLNESEDIVFDRNDDKLQLEFDGIKLKTLKVDDDDLSSTPSAEDQEREDENKTNLLKRATSITHKLSDTFNRLTTAATPTITNNCSQDLNHIDQFQFPLQLFKQNHLLHPYLSIHSLDLLNNTNVRSYLIGASNGLFRQQNSIDFILTDNDEDFLIQSSDLRQQLQLTTADLRFTQLFEDSQSGIKSEEEIRRLFLNYLLSLLAVARTPNEEAVNDFNSSFVKAFQLTDAFRLWQSKGPYPHFDQIVPRHPQSGQLNVTDVKLRVAHVLDDTETGRKLKGAVQDTSQFMGEKSRAATKVLGQAKNSLFTSVIGTFNQGKQWLSKPQPSSD